MVHILFPIAFLLMSLQAWGATYYVDATGGNDSNAGTTTNFAWKTISKVNGSFFSAGDKVLFKKGEIWREQLSVPSSGSTSSPITFGAYGSGANPVISGSRLVTTWNNLGGGSVWAATLTTRPWAVFFDNTIGTQVASQQLINSANKWFWSSNVLYVYSTSDPSTDFINPGIEAGILNTGIEINNKSYITLQNLDTTRFVLDGIYVHTLAHNVNINSCNSYNNLRHGIFLYKAPADGSKITNVKIDHNYVYLNGFDGIYILNGVDNVNISYNQVYRNCQATPPSDPYSAGIRTYSTTDTAEAQATTNVTIENNTVYNNNKDANGNKIGTMGGDGAGIWQDTPGPGCIIRYNNVYGNSGAGIMEENALRAQVYYNLSYFNNGAGIKVSTSSSTSISDGTTVYNNVIYGNLYGVQSWGVEGDQTKSTINNIIWKNNIIYGSVIRELQVVGGAGNDNTSSGCGTGNVWAYNSIGKEDTNFIEYKGWANYYSTYSDWENAYGGKTYSMQSDPLFVSTVTPDFSLQPTSPAINAGVSVGLTTDYAGNVVPRESGPDIGAFEYQGNTKRPLPPSGVSIN